MEEFLILKAQQTARDRLRFVSILRFSSAAALVVPAVASTLFLWAQTHSPASELLDGGTTVFDVIWDVWAPLSVLSLLTGGVFAWLGWRAYDLMKREIRLSPKGVEIKGPGGLNAVPWTQVTGVESGTDLLIIAGSDAWRLEGDWLGRAQAEEALAYLKERLPKNKLLPPSTRLELFLQAALRSLPVVFALLVTAILGVVAYWVLVRRAGPGPEPLLRAGPGNEQLMVPDRPPAP